MGVNRRIGQMLPFFSSGAGGLLGSIVDKLAGWWGNTPNDGCGNPVDKIGTDASTDRTVFKGRAYEGDGTNRTIYNDTILGNVGTGDFFISIWMKADAPPSTLQYLYDNHDGQSAYSGVDIFINATTGYPTMRVWGSGASTDRGTTTNVCDGEWHNIQFGRTNGSIYGYIDGVFQGGIASARDISSNNLKMCLGGRSVTANVMFEGQLRDFRVYDAWVGLDDRASIVAQETVQVADMQLWDFCESTDLNWSFDSSGNGNHGTKVSFISGNHIEGQWQSLLNKYGYSKEVVSNIELYNNWEFNAVGTWNEGVEWTITGGKAVAVGIGGTTLSQADKIVVGHNYKAIFEIVDWVSGVCRNRFVGIHGVNRSGNGIYEEYWLNAPTSGYMGLFNYLNPCNFAVEWASWMEYFSTEVAPDVSDPTKDVFGNVLTYPGQAKYNLETIQSACFAGDGVARASLNSNIDLGTDFVISFNLVKVDGGARAIIGQIGDTADTIIQAETGNYIRIYINSVELGWNDASLLTFNGERLEFVRSGDSVELFVDGVSFGAKTGAGSANFEFGEIFSRGAALIGTSSMWNLAFTSSRFLECETPTDAIIHYPLCEVSGTVYHDVSGNGNHAEIVSGDELNFGVQNDYHYLQQKGFLGVMNFANENVDYVNFVATVCNNLTEWSVAIRFDRYIRNILDFIIGGDNVRNIALCGGTQTLQIRDSATAYHVWDGTGNTVNVSSVSLEKRYVTLIMYADGTNVHAIVDGVYKGYITPATTELYVSRLVRGYSSSANGTTGIFWDFRFWNSNLGQAECLKYHNDVMTVDPTNNLSMIQPVTERTFYPDFGSITANMQGSPEQWIFPALADKSLAVNGAKLSHQQLGNLMLQYQTFLFPADIAELIAADARTVYGDNLVANGGGDNTTDWIDDNSNGIGDGFGQLSSFTSTYSIVTGNGFNGNAQRVDENNASFFATLTYQSFIPTVNAVYKIRFKYRCHSSIALRTSSGAVLETWAINTGDAIEGEWVGVLQDGTVNYLYFAPVISADGAWLEIDEINIYPITQQYGNSIYQNSGVRNAAGLVVNGDWIDSDSNGWADGFSGANATPSIVQGNGFNGNAQRVDVITPATTMRMSPPAHVYSTALQWTLRMKYRSTHTLLISNGIAPNPNVQPSANTGDAAEWEHLYDGSYDGSISIRIQIVNAPAGAWFEIDEFSVRQLIDTLFYEPEALGAEPVPFAINSIPEWSYGHHYSNRDDEGKTMKDLQLLAEDITYEEHIDLLKYTKNL